METVNWVAALLGENWLKDHPPTVKALRQSVIRLTRFKKERNSEVKEALIASFLNEQYCLPKIFTSQGKIVRCTSSSSSSTHD